MQLNILIIHCRHSTQVNIQLILKFSLYFSALSIIQFSDSLTRLLFKHIHSQLISVDKHILLQQRRPQ